MSLPPIALLIQETPFTLHQSSYQDASWKWIPQNEQYVFTVLWQDAHVEPIRPTMAEESNK